MAPPYIAGAARVDIRYNLTSGQQVQNVLFIAKPEPFDALATAASIRAVWESTVMPFLTNNVILTEVQVTDYSAPGGATGAASSGVAGSSTSSALPPNCTIALSWRTGLAGRSYRGRTYLPGIGEDKVSSGGVIDSSFVTSLLGMGTALIAAMASEDAVMVVASRKLGSGQTITSCIVDPTVDTQRRRLR